MAYACPAGNESRQLRTITRNWTRDQGMYEVKRHTAHKLTMSSKMLWAQMAKDNRRICRNHLGLLRYGGRFGQTMAKRMVEEESVVEEEEESVVEEEEESVVEEEEESVVEEEEESVVEEEEESVVATTETASEAVTDDADTEADIPAGVYPMTGPHVTVGATDVTDGSSTNAASLTITFELTEASDDFDTSSVTVTIDDVEVEGLLSEFTSDGTTYTTSVETSTDGTYSVVVESGMFTSSASGVSNLESNAFTWIYDGTTPTVTITGADTSGNVIYTNAIIGEQDVVLTFTFSEAPSDLYASDIIPTNCAITSNLSVSDDDDSVYTATFRTDDAHEVSKVEVRSGCFTDAVGNANTEDVTFSWTYTPPTVAITAGITEESKTNATTLNMTFTVSEENTTFDESCLTLSNCTLDSFSGDDTEFTAEISATSEGECYVTVAQGAFQSSIGTDNTETSFTWIYDGTAPTCTVTSNSETNEPYRSVGTVQFTITTDEDTTIVDDDDISTYITVIGDDSSTGTVTRIDDDDSSTVYTFEAETTGDTSYTVNIAANTFTDAAGNGNTADTKAYTWTYITLYSMVEEWCTNSTDGTLDDADGARTKYGEIDLSDVNERTNYWEAAIEETTDMSALFKGKNAFNEDISGWDVEHVEDMSEMFYGATDFNAQIGQWTTNNALDMSYMFYQATALNVEISSWDTSAVMDMSYMFYGATSFDGDITGWDTSKVRNMSYMFAYMTQFNQVIGSWDVSSVTDMSHMFYGATDFNQDISTWDTRYVTDMSYMFYDATSFNQDLITVDTGGNQYWDVSQVTDMSYMFYGATSFNGDITNWVTTSLETTDSMFSNAQVFNQNLNDWDVSQVTNMTRMFHTAYEFNNGDTTNSDSNPLDSWDVSSVQYMTSLFDNAWNFNQDISSWDISSVTNFTYMLRNTENPTYSNGVKSDGGFTYSLEDWSDKFSSESISFGSMFSNSKLVDIYKDLETTPNKDDWSDYWT